MIAKLHSEERTFDGRSVWHIAPKNRVPTAQLLYFHGGGWVLGDLDSYEAHAIRIANRTGAVVVNVDYRLAPEHRFPAALDDALAELLARGHDVACVYAQPPRPAGRRS